ncbi:Protein OCTOPUS-like [Arabidopsis suecica]|uniref:Protein OCTOPUS-like n=1 Tax=Arabidopsis suecica TaxID=45249 RepID=A0A8T2CPM6_ARASU|nr:Protein OCTOPUS-like [Arabidopsis suecica]
MKGQNKSSTSSCNIHPVEFIEGVCPLCLNERLLVLASLQRLRPPSPPSTYQTIQEPKTILQNSSRKKPIRIFSFLSFFELRHHKSDHKNTSIISPEDGSPLGYFLQNSSPPHLRENCTQTSLLCLRFGFFDLHFRGDQRGKTPSFALHYYSPYSQKLQHLPVSHEMLVSKKEDTEPVQPLPCSYGSALRSQYCNP